MPDQTPEQREDALKMAEFFTREERHQYHNTSVYQLARALLFEHAEVMRLRAALKDAPHDEDCAYIESLLRFDRATGRKIPTAECDCWKSRALAGSPDTEVVD